MADCQNNTCITIPSLTNGVDPAITPIFAGNGGLIGTTAESQTLTDAELQSLCDGFAADCQKIDSEFFRKLNTYFYWLQKQLCASAPSVYNVTVPGGATEVGPVSVAAGSSYDSGVQTMTLTPTTLKTGHNFARVVVTGRIFHDVAALDAKSYSHKIYLGVGPMFQVAFTTGDTLYYTANDAYNDASQGFATPLTVPIVNGQVSFKYRFLVSNDGTVGVDGPVTSWKHYIDEVVLVESFYGAQV